MAPRLLRANNILGKSIPPLIVLLAVKGYDLVVHETGSYLADVRRLPVVAELYRWHFRLLLAALVYAYGFVYLSPRTHSRPPKNPPPEVLSRTMVYQCDSSGAPATCNRDECEGSWKSARTRHCSDCGICKEMFDHHCPFMDSCITGSRTFKPFVCFLFYTVALVGVAIVPLAPLQLAAVSEVVSATWDLEWMHENWWKNWWSWIGGPVYR